MKKAKKVLLLVLCAALLVGASVAGTVAYLTSQDQVVNTFTVGKVQIGLDEASVNVDGTYVTNHENHVKTNDYHLLPGMTYIKDPTVTVKANSEKAYIRMLVKVTNIVNLEAVFTDASYYGTDADGNKVFLLQNLVDGWDPAIWVYEGYTADGNNGTYEFRYFAPVDTMNGNDLILDDLFETITIPGEDVDSDNIAYLDYVQIDVVAQAIQAAGFAADGDKTAEDVAWEAFN